MAYSQIHNKNKYEKELKNIKKWSCEKINFYFTNKTFSLNSKTPGKIVRKSIDFKASLIAANKANNNFPDIKNISGKNIEDVDLLTYSFPCQGLSIANMGRDKGINKKSKSTSNLIWQIYRILLEAKTINKKLPKYLLMENVKNLISKKHKNDYEIWKKMLRKFGYLTYTFVLNGIDHGSTQRRERLFAISILNHKRKWSDEEFKKIIDSFGNKLSLNERKIKYIEIMNSSDGEKQEILDATPNKTPSRIKMMLNNNNLDLLTREWSKNNEFTFGTLTTKQDRHPNIGMLKIPTNLIKKNKLESRFITNREGYMIMGFDSNDFSRVKKLYDVGHITKESLYRQAGNSIIVTMLESIFKFIKKYERGKCDL